MCAELVSMHVTYNANDFFLCAVCGWVDLSLHTFQMERFISTYVSDGTSRHPRSRVQCRSKHQKQAWRISRRYVKAEKGALLRFSCEAALPELHVLGIKSSHEFVLAAKCGRMLAKLVTVTVSFSSKQFSMWKNGVIFLFDLRKPCFTVFASAVIFITGRFTTCVFLDTLFDPSWTSFWPWKLLPTTRFLSQRPRPDPNLIGSPRPLPKKEHLIAFGQRASAHCAEPLMQISFVAGRQTVHDWPLIYVVSPLARLI